MHAAAGSKVHNMKPGLLAALLRDPHAIAHRAVCLKELLPCSNVSAMAAKEPELLLQVITLTAQGSGRCSVGQGWSLAIRSWRKQQQAVLQQHACLLITCYMQAVHHSVMFEWLDTISTLCGVSDGVTVVLQETDEIASQVNELKVQLGSDNVDRIVEEYPRCD